MTRRGAIGLLAGGTSILLTGCGPLADKTSYRFRVTLEVQKTQGLKTGSGVMEITAWHKFKIYIRGKFHQRCIQGAGRDG